jgi:hypothetical protein
MASLFVIAVSTPSGPGRSVDSMTEVWRQARWTLNGWLPRRGSPSALA